GNYVTFFYDSFEDNTVTAIQLIDQDLISRIDDPFHPGHDNLKKAFAYQLFDLTNASRVNHGLAILDWHEDVSQTAKKHSNDMAENDYFSHTSLNGNTLMHRVEADNIPFVSVGENLAYGQFSSIFAHQGLMNSEGHRENILEGNFKA